MRFTATILSVLVVATAVSAAAVERQLGGVYKCTCFLDKTGAKGVDLTQAGTTYTCAYPEGSCEWNQVDGELVNYLQPNCATLAPCVPS